MGTILELEGCDPRSIANFMTPANFGDRGREEALYCMHQLLKPPKTGSGKGKGEIRNPSGFLCNNIKACWQAMSDPYAPPIVDCNDA